MKKIIDNMHSESRSVKNLTDGLDDETIIIDDSFQRRFVWVEKDKISLIETILMGYPIPEVYLWQNQTDPVTGATIYSIVDGQQRIRSILEYVKGEFPLTKRSLENKSANYSGKTFDNLDAAQKSTIWKYKFSVRFISEEITKDQIVNIFLRLNRTNISLNPQELRNAEFNGEFIKLAEKITALDFWEKYFVFNSGDLRRMTDIQFVSTILIFLRRGISEETSQAVLNKIYDQYNENYPESKNDLLQTSAVLDILDKIAEDNAYCSEAFKTKTHLYVLFVLGYFLKESKIADYPAIGLKLEEWFRHYFSESNFRAKKKQALLSEYRALSQEGVQKKVNRQRRFEILKEYLNS